MEKPETEKITFRFQIDQDVGYIVRCNDGQFMVGDDNQPDVWVVGKTADEAMEKFKNLRDRNQPIHPR